VVRGRRGLVCSDSLAMMPTAHAVHQAPYR
jgi:hypothetical protein